MVKPASYFPALTGLRAVAAYCVFLFHFPPVEAAGSELQQVLHALCREGHIGVSLFFTLSGFLICQRYYQQPFGGPQLVRYALRRWARIWPVFFLATTATFLLNKLYLTDNALWLYVANITLLKGFTDSLAFTGIVQTWSLTVEECFYLLAPLLFWLARRFSLLAWLAVAAGLLALGWGIYGNAETGFQSAHFMLVATIFGRSSEFLLGAAFALAARACQSRHATWFGALLLLLLVGILTFVQLRTGKVSIDTLPGIAVNNLVLPAATGLLLWGLATESNWLQRGLSTPLLQVLGKSSYCFYLIHMGVWHDRLTAWLPASWPALLQFGVVFLLTVAVSVGLYYLVEKPLHKLLTRHIDRAGSARPALTFP